MSRDLVCSSTLSRGLVAIVIVALTCGQVHAADDAPLIHLKVRRDAGDPQSVAGRIVVEDDQGGVLLEDACGIYWTVPAASVAARENGPEKFERLNAEQLAAALQTEIGGESVVVRLPHYVVVSTAGKAYAEWCGALLERLRTSFLAYWQRIGLPLEDRKSPLPVLIFKDRQSFAEYAARDGAVVLTEGLGYYSARTNRIALFDLTSEQPGKPLGASATREEITRRLSSAQASVATVVHEATHQIAFNSGLQVRYADNPMWLTEGLAMYFEMPDLRSTSGWTGMGKVNPYRLSQFKASLPKRPSDSLTTLIQDEDRFRTPETMLPAYAESWTLVYTLMNDRHRGAFREYLRDLGQRLPLEFATKEERLQNFRARFGENLTPLDEELVRFARTANGR